MKPVSLHFIYGLDKPNLETQKEQPLDILIWSLLKFNSLGLLWKDFPLELKLTSKNFVCIQSSEENNPFGGRWEIGIVPDGSCHPMFQVYCSVGNPYSFPLLYHVAIKAQNDLFFKSVAE